MTAFVLTRLRGFLNSTPTDVGAGGWLATQNHLARVTIQAGYWFRDILRAFFASSAVCFKRRLSG